MQSGISASEDLHGAFQSLLSTPSTRGILATIASERLIPSTTISAASSFTSDLAHLKPHIKFDEAAYIILKQDGDGGAQKCVAITYVPDSAPVRQKMLFASTRLTLVRELGTEHFASTLFATTPEEVTAEGWAKHEAHGNLAAPLTEEEQNLEDIREAEAAESRGTGIRRGGHIVAGGVSMSVEKEAVAALQRLKVDGGAVVLNLNLHTEHIALVSTHTASDATPSTLHSLIPASSPTYTFYIHQSTHEVLFIYCCPAGCSVKQRMTYAASARSVPVMANSEAELNVSKKLEVSGVDELNEKEILREVESEAAGSASKTNAAGGFARPKRPGRR